MIEPFPDIVVPGSTSNLGPGFDTLSVAVNVYLTARVVDVRPDPAGTLALVFRDAAPRGENRITSAYALAAGAFGGPAVALDVEVSSDIPMAAGLGSSAAAAVAGLRLYDAARRLARHTGEAWGGMSDETLLRLATQLEGHPDNAAAAILGGITISCGCDDGRIIARSWTWPADIRLIVVTPQHELETTRARGVLPETVPLKDAIANLQRALLLVKALETGRYEDLREALRDCWHQPARAPLVPGLAEALTIEHPAVLGVCLSGAGPSVLALAAPGRAADASDVLSTVYHRAGVPHTIRNLAAHPPAMHTLPLAAAERERTA